MKAKNKIPSYFKSDGSPDRRYSISKYFKNDGTPNKRYSASQYFKKDGSLKVRAPKEFIDESPILKRERARVKRINKLLAPPEPVKAKRRKKPSGKAPAPPRAKKAPVKRKIPFPDKPWLAASGRVRKNLAIAKYLAVDGKLKKGVKLPAGVSSVEELWDYLQAKKIKVGADGEGLVCETNTLFYWLFVEWVEQNFDNFDKVFMAGKLVKSWDSMVAYIDEYADEIVDRDGSPPECAYKICTKRITKKRIEKYLYI